MKYIKTFNESKVKDVLKAFSMTPTFIDENDLKQTIASIIRQYVKTKPNLKQVEDDLTIEDGYGKYSFRFKNFSWAKTKVDLYLLRDGEVREKWENLQFYDVKKTILNDLKKRFGK